jgi:hypothetical protein
MIERYLQQIETAVTVGFSHTQIDPQVESLDNAAVIEFPSLKKGDNGKLSLTPLSPSRGLWFNSHFVAAR